jgi:EAL domain-containing protein (putative c-di-GMP-specific phosphodiesterase class I)/ActR/RegA family two-component response regulator
LTGALSQFRVLLVDDEAFVRSMTAKLLAQLGCTQILQAGSGREALGILDTPASQVDLLLCDLSMPDMDGVEIVRHLAARKERAAVIFLSGMESGALRAAEALARAYRLNVLGSLRKPASKDGLLSLLDQIPDEYQPKAKHADLLVTEDRLRQAIAAEELCLHYQPKVNIATGKPEGFESLVRWTHPEHGIVGPDKFVALAESTSLIGPMTEALVVQGFRQQAHWKSQGLNTRVSLNLSPAMLSDLSMPDRFERLAAELAVRPASIVFEITETGVARDEAVYLEIVTRLHLKGFALSIDDFGTGMSSLQKLEALPFAELKVDRQFVHGAHRNDAKHAILKASIGLAHSLNLKCVAEGVERQEDWDLLKELGCDVAQGFYVSKPMAPADVPTWLDSWRLTAD